ncbi:mitogen-activated protein kinase kinase kinase 20-like [Rhododendron vialii]|uniref:mitogen-activated protein kinase kinase kinase 20-like n=1 Tax=Rhododendron vialii TaxID=182163 RepID=UPI00265F70B8|nr:mitogen-activated protein kinase kinase kinase 20-like [Rhododendron vialii]
MWKISRPLGRGSFGFVSLAVSQPNDDESKLDLPSLVAIKSAEVFQSHLFQKECDFHAKLHDCPHILRCFGSFISERNGFLVYNMILEYASGGSLADRIRCSGGGGLPDNEVRWYTKGLLKGLSHMHKLGYVHCDIKPHNILLVGGSSGLSFSMRRTRLTRETVKIADFGQTKKAGKMETDGQQDNGRRGSPLFMAPESVLRQEYEPCSDIWAVGCTVLQMITGKPAWKCDSETETCAILYRIGFTEKVPEIPSWVSEEGRDFLRKCLAKSGCSWGWRSIVWVKELFVKGTDWRVGDVFRVRDLIIGIRLQWRRLLLEVLFPSELIPRVLSIHVPKVQTDVHNCLGNIYRLHSLVKAAYDGMRKMAALIMLFHGLRLRMEAYVKWASKKSIAICISP